MPGRPALEPEGQPSAPARRGVGALEIGFIAAAVLVLLLGAGLRVEIGFATGGDAPELVPAAEPAPGPDGSRPAVPVRPLEPEQVDDGLRPADITIQILNAGAEEERLAAIRTTLVEEGFRVAATNAARPFDTDVIFYTTGFEEAALLVADALGIDMVEPMTSLPPERRLSESVMVHVVAGSG
jgi:hypothetical protein